MLGHAFITHRALSLIMGSWRVSYPLHPITEHGGNPCPFAWLTLHTAKQQYPLVPRVGLCVRRPALPTPTARAAQSTCAPTR